MNDSDPISQFFPGQDDVDLYAVLSLDRDATSEHVKKAYRRLALICHPDKHATASEQAKADASTKFQQIGFAYTVLSDEKKRARYDKTGRTDEGFEIAAGEGGWEGYFEDLFDRVSREKLDDMKKQYQGSSEEKHDLKAAYLTTDGAIGVIMTHIPHSTIEDEPRFIHIISDLISSGELVETSTWRSTIKDEQARLARKKRGEKEAVEAEALAKELGVWDEFYGSGKVNGQKKKGKAKGKAADHESDDDHSALQALILKKKEKNMDGFLENLAAKYGNNPSNSRKGKKRKNETVEVEGNKSSTKKSRHEVPPELDDDEFAKLQEKLFSGKQKSAGSSKPVKRGGRE